MASILALTALAATAICADRTAPPRALTIRDRVVGTGYRDIRFARP